MQQYKFRALRSDSKTNKWVYGSLITTPEGTYILEEGDSVEYSEPDYHSSGMGCGLEDRGITDRYEAMEHGFNKAVEKCCELFPPFIPVKPETVGVCFGWIDSEGDDIYTDDQLELIWKNGDVTCEIITYSVEYGYFMYGNNPICELMESGVRSKIKGNIHLLNPAKGAVINTMLQDPNLKANEEVNEQAAGQDVAATEQEAQEQALESAEEGTTEG